MKPTEELTHEHDAIKVILDIMEKICVKIESGEKINSEHIEKIIEFIRIFADKCHHGKEEDLLFTALEEAGMPRETGPIRVMLDEHKIGREYVGGLSDALEKYKAGDEKALEKIVENARDYIKLLRQHIDKEDNILYPMADSRISLEKQSKLSEEFKKVETEKICKGKYEEFHKLTVKLREEYLK